MPLYEHVFLARQDISAQQVKALTTTYETLIADNGGKVEKSEYWGLKSLSYKIKKNRKAHYNLFNIDAPHEAVAEMERQMNLSTDVLRFMTIRVDEFETEPSVMMRKSDRDDRRGGPRGQRNFGGPRDSRGSRGDAPSRPNPAGGPEAKGDSQ